MKVKLNGGPLDGFDFDAGGLDDVITICMEFDNFDYFYGLEDGKMVFDDREHRYSRQEKRAKRKRRRQEMDDDYKYRELDCTECGELSPKSLMAKGKCFRCIRELVKRGDIIEA